MDAIRLPGPHRATLSRERKLARCGHGTIAGIDEVGRGPLAGPVVAAAVVLDSRRAPKGLADSKVLTREEREELFERILATAQVGIAAVWHVEIDVINIRQASLSAMCRALAALPCIPDIALVDGNDPPKLPCTVETIVKGDATRRLDRRGLDRRQGRARPADAAARPQLPGLWLLDQCRLPQPGASEGAERAGPCAFHRRSFAPREGGCES